MLIALTGTPGTGKSTVGKRLEARGYVVLDLDRIAHDTNSVSGWDEDRQTAEIDIEALQRHIRVSAKVAFLKSHYSHRMDVNLAIVLRCRPSVLRERLRSRGWSEEKIQENVEAEAIDVITQEAAQRTPFVYEVDTTEGGPEQAARSVLEILQGRFVGHEAGSVDWTDEVLSWY